ncbi:MAG: hypothetical protein HYW93_00080 [Thaumarchaeota archaeon]|nr:hypothetical protein [Nitrososphaerota archaeon]
MLRTLAISLVTVLVLSVALTLDLQAPQSPVVEPGFHLEFSKTGGIAGMDSILTIDGNGSAWFRSRYGTSFNATAGSVVLSELRNSIATNLPKISQGAFQAKGGAVDYFTYRLEVREDDSIREVVWVDKWAVEGTFPQELEVLQTTVENVLQILEARATFTNVNSVHADLSCESNGKRTLCGALSMTIYTDKARYKVGEKVRVFALVTNTGPPTINYTSPTPCDADIRLKVSADSEIRDLTYSDLPSVACVQVLQQRSLEANRTLVHHGTWNMSFDEDGTQTVAVPGQYTVSAVMPYAKFEPVLLEVSVIISVYE